MASQLERSIDKILNRYESELLEGLAGAHKEAQERLAGSERMLGDEYDHIIDEAKKEAQKIERQIIGSSNLKARNAQLKLVQEHIEKVFEQAVSKIALADRGGDYPSFISSLIAESVEALGTKDVVVSTSEADKGAVQSAVSNIAGAELGPDTIKCMGGVQVASKNGSMSHDNTIDSKIERMKPLIRKEIATRFGLGN